MLNEILGNGRHLPCKFSEPYPFTTQVSVFKVGLSTCRQPALLTGGPLGPEAQQSLEIGPWAFGDDVMGFKISVLSRVYLLKTRNLKGGTNMS